MDDEMNGNCASSSSNEPKINYVDRETFLRLCEATLKGCPANSMVAVENVVYSCWEAAQKFERLANTRY
jgi:hypothetical protein